MEPHTGGPRDCADRARAHAWWQERLTEEVGAPLRRRTPCAICRRVLMPAVLATVPHPDGWDGWNDGNDAKGVLRRGVLGQIDDLALVLPAALSAAASAATRYPAARAQRLAPRGYAVGAARGRWTGWVCASCAARLTVEEHQVGAQRALARRVAHLEQQLRFPLGRCSRSPALPSVPWPERQRAGRTGRTNRQHATHRDQAPWIVSLEAYRTVRRELRVCRQSLADLTATLASVDPVSDPVLAWPPLHLRKDPQHASATPAAPTVISKRNHWGGATRPTADPCGESVEPVEPVES